MKAWKCLIPPVFLAATLSLGSANTCRDGGSPYLPARIGIPGSALPEYVKLPCDTMIVRVGDTTRIHSSVRLHFGPQSGDANVILVKGVLIAQGTPAHPIFFSGSLVEHALGVKPGHAVWGGFQVTNTGALSLEHARLYNSAIIIQSQSENVRLENVTTVGCSHLLAPGNVFKKLDMDRTEIRSLDFASLTDKPGEPDLADESDARKNTGRSTAAKKAENNPSRLQSKWLWGGMGVAALSLGGYWYFVGQPDGGNRSPTDLDAPDEPLWPDRK